MRVVLNWVRLLAAAMGEDDSHDRELREAVRRACHHSSPTRLRRVRPDPEA